jgi:hypothetical protein
VRFAGAYCRKSPSLAAIYVRANFARSHSPAAYRALMDDNIGHVNVIVPWLHACSKELLDCVTAPAVVCQMPGQSGVCVGVCVPSLSAS